MALGLAMSGVSTKRSGWLTGRLPRRGAACGSEGGGSSRWSHHWTGLRGPRAVVQPNWLLLQERWRHSSSRCYLRQSGRFGVPVCGHRPLGCIRRHFLACGGARFCSEGWLWPFGLRGAKRVEVPFRPGSASSLAIETSHQKKNSDKRSGVFARQGGRTNIIHKHTHEGDSSSSPPWWWRW